MFFSTLVVFVIIVAVSHAFKVSLQGRSLHKPVLELNKIRAELRLHNDEGSQLPETSGKILGIVGALGVGSNVICDYSLYTVQQTMCGLPAGYLGLEGAAEGISYLTVAGLLLWSIIKKIKTGSGLPAGPAGLLGASEGLSYLTLLAAIAVYYLMFTNHGYLPGGVPKDICPY